MCCDKFLVRQKKRDEKGRVRTGVQILEESEVPSPVYDSFGGV